MPTDKGAWRHNFKVRIMIDLKFVFPYFIALRHWHRTSGGLMAFKSR